MATPTLLDRFKIVERDPNGKVIQVHEVYRANVPNVVKALIDNPGSVTVTKL